MTELSKILLTFIGTALCGIVVHYLTTRGKVSEKDFSATVERIDKSMDKCVLQFSAEIDGIKKDREKSWTDHGKHCPEKRDLMSEQEHDMACKKSLAPIYTAIQEIKEDQRQFITSISDMAKSVSELAQTQAVTNAQIKILISKC